MKIFLGGLMRLNAVVIVKKVINHLLINLRPRQGIGSTINKVTFKMFILSIHFNHLIRVLLQHKKLDTLVQAVNVVTLINLVEIVLKLIDLLF